MSVALEVKVDATAALHMLRNGEKEIKDAIAGTINATLLRIQSAERARVLRVLHVRKVDFITRQVAVIKPFASAVRGDLFGVISVGDKPRLLLSKFEAGGERGPFVGANVALPAIGGARPSLDASVSSELFVKALGFHRVGGRRGHGPIEGALNTYIVPLVGIFQRMASGASRILYFFKRTWKIPRVLGFVDTARQVIDQHFAPELLRRINNAFRHSWRIGL